MANIRTCNKHNMIACVAKTEHNADFHQIIDYLAGCSINYSLLVDPDLIGPWLQQFWATASLRVINEVPHIRAMVAGKRILISEETIRADLLFDDADGVDCFPKQVIWDSLRDIGYEGNLAQLTLYWLRGPKSTSSWEQLWEQPIASTALDTPLTPTMLEVQGTASFHGTDTLHDSDAVQGTDTLQGTAAYQGTASIPKSPNDYTPTDASQTSGGDEGLLDIYALNREVKRLKSKTPFTKLNNNQATAKHKKLSKFQKRRRKRQKKKVSSVKLGRNKGEEILSEEHNVQEDVTTHHNADDTADQDAAVTSDVERRSDETEEVNIEEKEASNVKSGETEELDLETTQSTARQGTITPRILNFEEEAGPSSPLRPIQVMDSEEQLKAAEVLVSISRPRGLSIPGPIQSQPQQPTQGTDTQRTDPKDKGKGILVEEPKKKKMTLQQIRALETTNDEEVARKIQAEWDAEEERKRFEELKKTKPKTTLRKPTSLAQERNQMMSFLKGQGYKNLQKLKYPQMKELYDKVQESIKDSFKDFIPMDSEKEREMLKERESKRLLRKRKATISEEQPSKKPKLRAETIDELRNYLRVVDFEKNAQDRESLEGISMITELQVIDSPDGEYLIIHRANNHFRAFDTLWEILHILDRQDLYHLYRVVQDYYEHIPPTGLGLILLGDLTIIWETAESSDDDFWKNQEDWEIIRWRFHESSGVHTLELEDGTMIHMLAERRYPLSRELMIRMLDHGMEVEDETETAITLIHLFILWTTEDGISILQPSSGVKLPGGAVSRDADFISGLAMRRAANAVDLMGLLSQLHDPRNHILRDSGICGMDDDYVFALACLHDMIPSFNFSGFTNKDIVPFKAQQTLANVLFSKMVKDMEVHFDMTMRQNAVFECLRAPHARDFLLAIPIDGLGQHMSPVEYRTILKRVGISSKKEAPVNFLTDPSDGRSTLRPADVLVFGWVGGKHAYVDLTAVSPLVGLSSRGFTAGQTALKAASSKVTKHEKTCIENQHVFISFAFDTFGFLAPEAVELLSRVQRVMHSNVMTPRSTNVVFKRIGFAIQKGLAAQLVARLPSTTIAVVQVVLVLLEAVVDKNNGRIVATDSTVEHSIKNSIKCGGTCNAKAATVVGEVFVMRLKVKGLVSGQERGILVNVDKELEKKNFENRTKVWAVFTSLKNNEVKLIRDEDIDASQSG
ncbi:putative reverse transcriptase domain-containing protein [Tanacetum coccineum]